MVESEFFCLIWTMQENRVLFTGLSTRATWSWCAVSTATAPFTRDRMCARNRRKLGILTFAIKFFGAANSDVSAQLATEHSWLMQQSAVMTLLLS
jgi:hypothetical protein